MSALFETSRVLRRFCVLESDNDLFLVTGTLSSQLLNGLPTQNCNRRYTVTPRKPVRFSQTSAGKVESWSQME